jgi:hypothetical protein
MLGMGPNEMIHRKVCLIEIMSELLCDVGDVSWLRLCTWRHPVQ